jgi:N-methylhydantoinase A
MAGALRLVSVQRGHDPRDFALVAFGGAGPLHANAVAKLMGSYPVIVPPSPGLLCAIGDLVADFRNEFTRSLIRLTREAPAAEVAGVLDELGGRAREWMDSEGIGASDQRLSHVADMRYHGQGYEIPVALDATKVRADGLGDLEERFNALHEQLYGFRMHATASEIVNLRAIGNGSVQKPELPTGSDGGVDASGAVVEEHQILFEGANVPTRIYDRSRLSPGGRIAGPAVITEFDSTTVVLPGFTAEVDIHFNLLINPGA